MSKHDDAVLTIDLLIDTLAELERIELSARGARERLTPICTNLFDEWREGQK
ncbi:hypothetical protein [Pyruvatibacter mobilis]|uniref:hypothetical protein n=1 Tax=Pyruvatibacter mobilis TaxID=1712261 RepID=UPI003BAD161B